MHSTLSSRYILKIIKLFVQIVIKEKWNLFKNKMLSTHPVSGFPFSSVTTNCTIGGGSIGRRSFSPNPHIRARKGC